MTATLLTIGSIDFNDNAADSIGSLWYIDGIDGWDSPPQRLTSAPLPAAHGEVTVENLYSARSLVVTGVCKASSGNNMYQSMYYLAAQTNALNIPIIFSVTEDVERFCYVLRSGPVKMAYVGKGAFTFEANFRADDPVKYASIDTSETLTGGAPQTLENAGSVKTYPTITLLEAGDVIITSGIQEWQATGMPSGAVIDMKAMTVLLGGTSYYQYVTPVSDWIYFSPGDNVVESSLNAIVHYSDAWI